MAVKRSNRKGKVLKKSKAKKATKVERGEKARVIRGAVRKGKKTSGKLKVSKVKPAAKARLKPRAGRVVSATRKASATSRAVSSAKPALPFHLASASPAPEICDGFSRALDIESEGRRFYIDCAQNTTNQGGKDMFLFLAREEKIHYDRISEIFRAHDERAYMDYVEAKGLRSGIFPEGVAGGRLTAESDALDSINIGIAAELNSIMLYERLSAEAPDEEMRLLFSRLVDEERHHRSILENEVEFVTKTGDFSDFRTVSM